MINHNIINKIFYKSWLEGMKLVNQEYLRNYVYIQIIYSTPEYNLIYYPYKYHKQDIIIYNLWESEIFTTDFKGKIFQLVRGHSYYNSGVSYVKWVASDKGFDDMCEYMHRLPKRYYYSSGIYSPRGYKECKNIIDIDDKS